jgi:imidazolonepropionase-like amidohydrolase
LTGNPDRGTFLLENALIFDGVSPDLTVGHVLVKDGLIEEVSAAPIRHAGTRIDLKGRVLMPGLIDAHIHAYFPEIDPLGSDRLPITATAHHARTMLEGALARGFTSVRDCGGGDIGLQIAIERGWIKGPRFFYCGPALSQTGGHGDKRPTREVDACGCSLGHRTIPGYKGHRTLVVDGVENLRIAVRDAFRKGGCFIKILGSGGIASPGALRVAQYSDDEIRAVVEEVERFDSYVTAHVHPDAAMRRAIELGVHCIEHGTMIESDTAELAAQRSVAVVPTLSALMVLAQRGGELGFPKDMLEKVRAMAPVALTGLDRLQQAGVRIGFGTDLIGPLHVHQADEFTIRREVQSAFEILRSATSVNAGILRRETQLGQVAPGFAADLIAIDGNPLDDIAVFTQDGRNLPLIVKDGAIAKRTLP